MAKTLVVEGTEKTVKFVNVSPTERRVHIMFEDMTMLALEDVKVVVQTDTEEQE